MLSKHEFPQLNRAQRRHPQEFANSLVERGWEAGGNTLLLNLLARGGYLPTPVAVPA